MRQNPPITNAEIRAHSPLQDDLMIDLSSPPPVLSLSKLGIEDTSVVIPETPDIRSTDIAQQVSVDQTPFCGSSNVAGATPDPKDSIQSSKPNTNPRNQSASKRRKKFVPPLKKPEVNATSPRQSLAECSQHLSLPNTALSPEIAAVRLPQYTSAVTTTTTKTGPSDVSEILHLHSQVVCHKDSAYKDNHSQTRKKYPSKNRKKKPVMRLEGRNIVLRHPPMLDTPLTPVESPGSGEIYESACNLIRRRQRRPLQQRQPSINDNHIQSPSAPGSILSCNESSPGLSIRPSNSSSMSADQSTITLICRSKTPTSSQMSQRKRVRQDTVTPDKVSNTKRRKLASSEGSLELESDSPDDVWKFTATSNAVQPDSISNLEKLRKSLPAVYSPVSAAPSQRATRSIVLTSLHSEYVYYCSVSHMLCM